MNDDKCSLEEFLEVGKRAYEAVDEYVAADVVPKPAEPAPNIPDLFPTAETMPDWWPPERPPARLKPGFLYRDKDGHWRTYDGRLVSRADRRKAGIR
jgi:hypothetical protein